MSSETTYAGKMGDVRRLINAVGANSADLPHLQAHRERLEALQVQAEETHKQQAALKASKQEMSLRLRTVIGEGQRVANALRSMLKEHYGLRSEKLAEFGIQPFRGRAFGKRKRASADAEASADAGAPASETPDQNA